MCSSECRISGSHQREQHMSDSLVDQLTNKFNPEPPKLEHPNAVATTAWAVVSSPIEYNDEYYYEVGEGAIGVIGNIVHVGANAEIRARETLVVEQRRWLRQIESLDAYQNYEEDDPFGITNAEEFVAGFNLIFGTDYDQPADAFAHLLNKTWSWDKSATWTLTDEQADALAELLPDFPGMPYLHSFTIERT